MNSEHVILKELLDQVQESLAFNKNWIAYNTISYFLGEGDIYFFKDRDSADEFSANNISEYDDYRVIYARSIDEVLRQIPYGETFQNQFEKLASIVLSAEVLDAIGSEHANDKHWLAYNMEAIVLQRNQIYFAASKGEAIDFAFQHNSSTETYRVIHFHTAEEAIYNIQIKNVSIMNEKNLEYLEKNLLYAGFADHLNELLKKEISKQQPEFTLKHEGEINKTPVKAELYFKKSNETDLYFFNKYDVQMKTEKDGQQMQQTFYINNGHGISLKEAYNLLNGRAVHKQLENKEGAKYTAWVKLDFGEKDSHGNFKRLQFHEKYGYNVAEALAKYPIKELLDEKQKEDLIKSVQKGNVQAVTFEKNGTSEKLFVEANPQFKTVNVYDMKMQRIEKQELVEKYGQGMNAKENQSAQQSSKQSSKQDSADDDAGGQQQNSKKRTRKKGQSLS